jgi:hypothetical protein
MFFLVGQSVCKAMVYRAGKIPDALMTDDAHDALSK